VNGPQHYGAAEDLLRSAESIPPNTDETNPCAALLIARAQVHATLALAAATAEVEPVKEWHAAVVGEASKPGEVPA
jgi:hypothetical protein